jgi:hypothetical protein
MIVSLVEAFHTCQRYLGHLSYVVLPHVQGSEKKIGQNYNLSMVRYLTKRRNQRQASGLHKQTMSNVQSGDTKGLLS